MSKRRITKQQHIRIKELHEERRKRASTLQEQSSDIDQLGPEQQGTLVTHYGRYADVEYHNKKYRCHFRQNLGMVVVGDKVVFRIDESQKDNQKRSKGIIVALSPRESLLWRMGDRNEEKPIAANIDQMIIVIAPQPEPSLLLLDSYLIAAEHLNLTPLILFNKIDLFASSKNLDNEESSFLEEMINIYQSIGYQTIQSSIITQDGIDELKNCLLNHRSVFIGQSGVGKSSLINKLLPEEALITGELHEATGLGRHTTTTSRLYHLPQGGELIDSPGIREFCLWKMEPQKIAKGFKEFLPFIKKCRFRNCKHLQEPDCAIIQAVQAEKIHLSRFEHYKKLIHSTFEG